MSAPTVSAVIGDDGSVSVGVTVGGKFVPVASTPANIVRHYTEDVPAPEKASKGKTNGEES